MIRLGMKGVVVADTPEKSITKSDLCMHSGTHDRLTEFTSPARITVFEQIQALDNQRRKDLLDKISGRSATLEWADRTKTVALGNMPADLVAKSLGNLSGFESAGDAFKRTALGNMHADLLDKISGGSAMREWADRMKTVALGTMPASLVDRAHADILSGLESAGDSFKRAALGNMHADLLDKIRGRSATLEWADRMKTVALGTMPADLVGKSLGSLSGFEPAADAFKRWEQVARSVRPQGDPELVPIAPAPIRRIAPQPRHEPNHVCVIAEFEIHRLILIERWMAVFDRERTSSMSDDEAAAKAVRFIAENEGEKPNYVWIVIRQELALRTEKAMRQFSHPIVLLPHQPEPDDPEPLKAPDELATFSDLIACRSANPAARWSVEMRQLLSDEEARRKLRPGATRVRQSLASALGITVTRVGELIREHKNTTPRTAWRNA